MSDETNRFFAPLRMTNLLPIVAGGVLFGLAFPKTNVSGAAWVALVPLLVSCLKKKDEGVTVLWLSILYGMIANAVIFYWIVPTCRAAGVSWTVSLLAGALLAFYHALYFTGFSLLMTTGTNPTGHPGAWPFQAAALWVALEYLRAHALSGFPWSLLANTQWRNLPALQIAELAGPYGVSFLVVLANAGLALFWLYPVEAKAKLRGILYPGLVIALALFWGQGRLKLFSRAASTKTPTLKVAILQGNIDQYQKWDDAYEENIRKTYEELLESARSSKPDLIIWPETAVPGWFPNEIKYAHWVRQEALKDGAYELIGAPTTENKRDYNGAFLISPQGIPVNRYLKIHLVPFGEYVPLRPLLAPWIHVLNEMGSFSTGREVTLFQIPKASFGASICFEAIFPDLIRRLRGAGAEFLVNITNDGWFLDTSAPEQHMAANVLRAIENRTCVVRAANTGISCIIEPSGRIQSRTPLLVKTVLLGQVAPSRRLTLYDRRGDAFAWFCLLGFAASLPFRRKIA
jgi:apolipoprotein N-acyltransferase